MMRKKGTVVPFKQKTTTLPRRGAVLRGYWFFRIVLAISRKTTGRPAHFVVTRYRLNLCRRDFPTNNPMAAPDLQAFPLSLASSPENRLPVRLFFTTMARAFRCPITITSFLPRVMPV